MPHEQFTVLTMNVALLRIMGFYEPVPHVSKRLAAFLKQVSLLDADVLCLQEVWSVSDLETIITALKDEYPHMTAFPVGSDDVYVQSGLCVLSRREIMFERYVVYEGFPAVHEYIAQKGAIVVCMYSPLGATSIVNTHLVHGGPFFDPNGRRMRNMRKRQIDDLVELADQQYVDASIIVGDLNAGPVTSPENYAAMAGHGYLDARHLADTSDVTSFEHTCDKRNPLNVKMLGSASDRIDHVFLAKRDAAQVRVVSCCTVLSEHTVDVRNDKTCPVSDHYGVLATFERR